MASQEKLTCSSCTKTDYYKESSVWTPMKIVFYVLIFPAAAILCIGTCGVALIVLAPIYYIWKGCDPDDKCGCDPPPKKVCQHCGAVFSKEDIAKANAERKAVDNERFQKEQAVWREQRQREKDQQIAYEEHLRATDPSAYETYLLRQQLEQNNELLRRQEEDRQRQQDSRY